MRALIEHQCKDCPQFLAVFSPIDKAKTTQQRKQCQREHVAIPSPTARIATTHIHFPPSPIDKNLFHETITGFANNQQVSTFLEPACSVCGLLTPKTSLCSIESVSFDRELLCSDEPVTRVERHSINEPIQPIPGPVLLSGCNDICPSCAESLKDGKKPIDALANGLWIRDIPEELKDLEKMIMSRVKHNLCIVKVHVS
ncbi:hypothetical protein C8Q80DRAFT_1101336 [Daedaleopsis nitida]|nr:hypothetical protein C8Q80DRAFT_1101336 [Daedaleopsis nitida]